jgi:hypothetical protein
MHNPSTNRKFCDKHGNAIKKEIMQDYNKRKRYTGKGDRMMNSYSTQCWTWMWGRKLFFPCWT